MDRAIQEKIENIRTMFREGMTKYEIAKDLGYKDHKGLYAYMKRHGYIWDESEENYVLYEEYKKQDKVKKILKHGGIKPQGKSAVIMSMLSKGMGAKEVSKKLSFQDHKEMASYMKAIRYMWDIESNNYKKEAITPYDVSEDVEVEEVSNLEDNPVKVETEGNSTLGEALLDRYGHILHLLEMNREKLEEMLDGDNHRDNKIPRYMISGLAITKSVHMISTLDELTREFSKEKNISQRDIFQIAIIEFFKKYGYRREIEALIERA